MNSEYKLVKRKIIIKVYLLNIDISDSNLAKEINDILKESSNKKLSKTLIFNLYSAIQQ